MSRLLEVADLCSSNVSDPANRLLKRTDSEGSSSAAEKKSSAVPLFRSGHMSAICARPSKGKGRFTRGWKPQVSTLLCARAASAQIPSLRKCPLPMSISSRLTNTRKKGILILPAGMAELADAPDLGSGVLDVQVQVLLPAPTKNAVESLHSVFLLLIFTWTACSVPSAQSAPSLR